MVNNKNIKKLVFLLSILAIFSSFIHKDLNEYGKWLKFYGLEDEDFKQVGMNKPFKFDSFGFDLNEKSIKLYEPLFFYSPDSTYFLDLDSYSLVLDKDAKGNLTWMGGDPEEKVQLVKTNDLSASTLLFFGTEDFAETAIWRNKYLFEIYGFHIRNGKFIPTIWKYNLESKTLSEFESKKTFDSRPNSYLIDVRLKSIKQK